MRLDQKWDLPNHEIGSFTVVSNQIFLGLSGYLVKCDLDSKRTEVLASSRRADKRSDLDNSGLFQTPLMVRDAKRDRIIVMVERGRETFWVRDADGSSTWTTDNDKSHTEFWALDPATGRLMFMLNSYVYPAGFWGNPSGPDLLVFSSWEGVDVLHLETTQLERMCSYGSVRGTRRHRVTRFLGGTKPGWLGRISFTKAICGVVARFGCVSLADKKTERFPLVSAPDPEATPVNLDPFHNNIPFCFVPLSNNRNLLLGTAAGAWLLPLR